MKTRFAKHVSTRSHNRFMHSQSQSNQQSISMNDSNATNHDETGTDGFETMGIMNALKTGNAQADMAIAMFLPFLLRLLASAVGPVEKIKHWAVWRKLMFWENAEKIHRRTIIYETSRRSWGETFDVDQNSKNSVLQKAITMYIHQVLKLKMVSAYLKLTPLEDTNAFQEDDDSYYSDEEEDKDTELDDDVDDSEYGSKRTVAGMLSRYKVLDNLPEQEWHELGTFGNPGGSVKLRIITGQGITQEGSVRAYDGSMFILESSVEGLVDTFVETAYSWYLEELRKQESNARYLYEIQNDRRKKVSESDRKSPGAMFKRYKLSDEKSFDSLFFQEKTKILSLLDHFANKTGKYAVEGFPHKLGLLLHGPPGTGKTSLIKAVAHYTGRSIVNVPLSKISTNTELMSIFHDKSYAIQGSSMSIRMDFKDVIFVMEDVDAATNIVKRRDGRNTAPADGVSLPTPKSMWRMLLESTSEDCKVLVKLLVSKSDRLRKDEEIQRSVILQSVNQRLAGLPALGLVDEVGNGVANEVCSDALEIATKSQARFKKLDEILASHAKSLKSKIENGFEVDDNFVDDLLDEVKYLNLASIVPPNQAQRDRLNKTGANSKSDKNSSLFQFKKRDPDALSLSGLLNVLDGVVDTPGRIVIMTTNHPEMLDPALIRPGRIDKRLLLGHMNSNDIVAMLEHYFQESLNKSQVTMIHAALNGPKPSESTTCVPLLKLTPAQVEQLAAEHDDLDAMVAALCEMSPVKL